MQTTIYDRDVLRQVIVSKPTGDQAVSWLEQVLKLADNGKNFKLPFPHYLTNHHTDSAPVSQPEPTISSSSTEEKEETDVDRFVSRALRWAERQTFEFAFRRDVTARDRSVCRFGSHRIDQGDEIAKIGVSGTRGDVLNLWGCIPCFEAIVDEYHLDVDD